MKEGPLDMRMDPTRGESARELCERLSADELADVLYQYGEERRSRPVARSIKAAIDAGHLETTEDLVRAVRRVLGPKTGRIDPVTRSFQALRIAVNGELDELRSLCARAPDRLVEGGIVAIISFHSLEDRIVKHAFRDWSTDCVCPPRQPKCTCRGHALGETLTRKSIVATDEEIRLNPRARSARLRVWRKK